MGEPGKDPWRDARPPLVVGLVTTVDQWGRPNASPKTWWTPTSYSPAMMLISVKPESDTAHNIEKTGVWNLHLPPRVVAKEVLHTAKPLPRGQNELDDVGLPWEWLEHPQLSHPIPKIQHMPFFVCWAVAKLRSGDHSVYEGQVGVSGGYPLDEGVDEVVLHRGKNRFVALGPEFDVEAY